MKQHRPRTPQSGSAARPQKRDSRPPPIPRPQRRDPREDHCLDPRRDPRAQTGTNRTVQQTAEPEHRNIGPIPDHSQREHDQELPGPEVPQGPRMGLIIPDPRPEFCNYEDSDVVQTRDFYTIEMRENEVFIYDREGTQITRIWGDPHVEEADGQTNWHFGEDSTFILPDGTKICLNTEPDGGEWYVVGAEIISGSSRYHWGEGGESGMSRDGKEWDATHADSSEDASAGVFALQDNGEWAVMGDDGRFYDITAETWEDYLSDKDIDYDPTKVVESLGVR